MLLVAGADPSIRDHHDNTPLDFARWKQQAEQDGADEEKKE